MRRSLSMQSFVGLFVCMLFVAVLVISPVHASPGILHVAPGGNCGGVPDCYGSIQDAINAAVEGDEIRIAKGTYSQVSTGAGITAVAWIVHKLDITLRGGYTTSDWENSNPEANPTIIDPQGNGVGIFVKYQKDTRFGDVIVDGLSITGGNASEAVAGDDSGGGILVDQTTKVKVTIQNCNIYENSAEDGKGAGIWVYDSIITKILDNKVHDNEGSGVGVSTGHNTAIIDNEVKDNEGYGIGIFGDDGDSADIRGNRVSGHPDSGIRLHTLSGGSCTENAVTDNHPTDRGGGGMDITGVIHDFLISNNTVRGNSSMQGGGIDISGSIAVISNNLIEGNSNTPISNGGGGLYVNAGAGGSKVLVRSNQVLSNTSTNQGGGMVIIGYVDVLNNTIVGNSGFSGGGLVATATGTIGENLIRGNWAQLGGGIRLVNPMGTLLQRNRVIDNRATSGDGGGINVSGGFNLDATLDGNQVISNTATSEGGGIYLECPGDADPLDISNTVLAGNVAAKGSGLYSTVCQTRIAYSSVSGNRGTWGDGIGFYLRDPWNGTAVHDMENTILVSQTIGVYVETGSATMEATFWGSGDWANDAKTGGPGTVDTGTKNYEGDPDFVDPADDDYHVTADSPVIEKGIDTWIEIDMDGQPRPLDEKTDIGADEYGSTWKVYLPAVKK